MAGKFELKESVSGQFMFNLRAGNNQVILTSDLYQDKASAKNGIDSVKKHAGADGNYERKTSTKNVVAHRNLQRAGASAQRGRWRHGRMGVRLEPVRAHS